MEFDLMQGLDAIGRSLASLIILFFITKLMGKKQVSELSLFDYVIGISIGNFTAEMVMNHETPYLNGVIAIVAFGLCSYLVSILTMKNITLRRFFIGVPTVLIEDGIISLYGLRKAKLDINDLLEQCRELGYFDISEISYAILEVNGKLSVLPKADFMPPTLKDLSIKGNRSYLSINVIIDGKLMEDNLKFSNKGKKWLDQQLKNQGYSNYDLILLATITNGVLSVFEKDLKKPIQGLE